MKNQASIDTAFPLDIDAIVSGLIPDESIRHMLRFGIARQLRSLENGGISAQSERKMELVRTLRGAPLLVHASAANEQHYEVNAALFEHMLGARMKYSCGLWAGKADDLASSEEAMLSLVVERAEIKDGQTILDLGCGWGSLCLYLAERLPSSRIMALSNSHSQKKYIDAQAQSRRLGNIEVYTADVTTWSAPTDVDRVVSIEMFEHMRNYETLLAKIASWLTRDGRLFVHIMSHLRHAYVFENNWMADRFFTGGIMPSSDLLTYFQRDLLIVDQWAIDGTHYQRTMESWLDNLDRYRSEVLKVLRFDTPDAEALKVFVEWRLFVLSCSEAFGYREGGEWMISHYLFRPR